MSSWKSKLFGAKEPKEEKKEGDWFNYWADNTAEPKQKTERTAVTESGMQISQNVLTKETTALGKVTPSTQGVPTTKVEVKLPADEQIESKDGKITPEEESKKDSYFGFWGSKYYKPFKPVVKKKLTVLLLENTSLMGKHTEILMRIIKGLSLSDLLCVIQYGSKVEVGEIRETSTWKDAHLFQQSDLGEKACLFDALAELELLISKTIGIVEEKEKEKVKIDTVDVIGIGTCKDNGSKISKEQGIERFYWVANRPNIITKYFCLTEENFADAAEIGFHSIGAILRN